MAQEQSETRASIDEEKRTSLMASLMHSIQQNEEIEATKSDEEKKGLSRAEIIDEILLFLVATFETTSTALAWFIHLVSKHPRVQTKLKAELAVNSFSPEHLDSFLYLDAVIREVLRFAPPSNGTVRTVMVDDRVPMSAVQLYKGEQIIIPFYNRARNPRYWKVDPEQFYPERFLEGSFDKHHHPYALIPFGSGDRQCIGQDLPRFELKVVAARLMEQMTFGDGGSDLNSGGMINSSLSFENILLLLLPSTNNTVPLLLFLSPSGDAL